MTTLHWVNWMAPPALPLTRDALRGASPEQFGSGTTGPAGQSGMVPRAQRRSNGHRLVRRSRPVYSRVLERPHPPDPERRLIPKGYLSKYSAPAIGSAVSSPCSKPRSIYRYLRNIANIFLRRLQSRRRCTIARAVYQMRARGTH